MTKSSPVVVHGGFLSKKGTGILKRGLAGRTNWKTRFFVLFYTDQARTRAGLNYYDSAPKDSFGGRVLSSVPPSPLGTINLCHLSKVATVVNPSHKEKFCFEITVNDSTGGDDDAMNLAALESKFTPEELSNYGSLFASVDDDSTGSLDVEEVGMLLEAIGQKVSSQEELQAIVDEVDDDGSGEIEYDEFLTIMWNLKSGKGTSKLAKSMSSALSSNIFSKAVKSPFKAKEPQNVRQLWSADEEDRTRWILAIEGCVSAMNEIREADKEKKRARKRSKKKNRKKKKNSKNGEEAPSKPPGLDTDGVVKGVADESQRHRGESGAVEEYAPDTTAKPLPSDLAGIIEAEAPPPLPKRKWRPRLMHIEGYHLPEEQRPHRSAAKSYLQLPFLAPPPSFITGGNSEAEDRLSREKEDLQNQLMMVIRMNEELNSSLEEANKNHTDEASTLRAHLEVLNSELEISKSKKLSNLKTLDEENLRLEVALDALKEEAASSRTKEEMAKNKLERSQSRLQRVEKELKEEVEKVKAMSSEISLLKETKDVLESELEATATKVESVWSSPLKKKPSTPSKSRFQMNDENEKAIESLKKDNRKYKTQLDSLQKSNSELERRLLAEDGDEHPAFKLELDATLSNLEKKDNENKVLSAKLRLLEGELSTLRKENQEVDCQEGNVAENDLSVDIYQVNPDQLTPPSSPPPPPPPEEDLEEELRTTRLQAEKWQQAAMAAANVAIEAASVHDSNESLFDLGSKSIDVDVLMERISVLEGYRSEGAGEVDNMNERLKAAEVKLQSMGEENNGLKKEVEGLNEKKSVQGIELDELKRRLRLAESGSGDASAKMRLQELESLNESLLKKTDTLEKASEKLNLEMASRSATSIELLNKVKAAEEESSFLRRDSVSLEERRAHLEETVKSLKEDVRKGELREDELLDVIQNLQREKDEIERQTDTEKRNLRRSSVQDSLTKEQQRLEEIKALQGSVDKKEEELKKLRQDTTEGSRLQGEVATLRKSETQLKTMLEKLKSEISDISETNESLTVQLNQTTNDTGIKSEQLMKYKAEVKILKAKVVEAESQHMRVTGELEVARDELASQEKFILESGMTHRGVMAKLKGINEGVVKENKAHLAKIDRLMSKCEKFEGVVVESEELKRSVEGGRERVFELESAVVHFEEKLRKAQREGETLRRKLLDEVRERREEREVWGGKEKAWAEEKEGLLEDLKNNEKKNEGVVGGVSLELERMRSECAKVKGELEDCSFNLEGAKKRLGEKGSEMKSMEMDLAACKRELKRNLEELVLRESMIGNLEKEKDLSRNEMGEEMERLRGNVSGLKTALQSKEAELRMAALSAQDAQEKVKSLTAEVEGIGVDFGIRVKELEGDCREERAGRVDAERELRSLRIKCDGLEGKVKSFSDSLAKEKKGGNEMGDKLIRVQGELANTREEMTSRVLELEGKLSKESSLRKAGERREKSFKGDLSVLSSEMVEMNRKMDEHVGEIKEKDMLIKGLEKELDEVKIKSRKEKELERLRGGRMEEEEDRMRHELGELERHLRASRGECKGLKEELRRSKVRRSGAMAGVQSGVHSRREEEEHASMLDLDMSYVSRGINSSDLRGEGRGRGGNLEDVEDDDIDFDLTVSRVGARSSMAGGRESWRTRSVKEERIAEQIRKEMGK
ncbi:hypothetical protein TrRE_jg6350 [Triparma retinervis]|uniref:Calmodulin n=1 Tax=Triparma retinervis TaxID=2557542 RepID=A0A9W7FWT1_9STRA|nr:hypothetical protein TrRE_jg6350 [Triparma retinervis]